MIIDCHGHYTTAPNEHFRWRAAQIVADRERRPAPAAPRITDDDISESLRTQQLSTQDQRGVDITLFSGHAGQMGHHLASATANARWAGLSNDLVHRACVLHPTRFVGVCQLPQAPGVGPSNCVAELRRCVEELGFVGCNINPDPTGGYWRDPPITDRYWYPLFEALVELDVPAMIHTSSSANRNFQGTGDHYLNGDTTAFMQLLMGDLFADFPTLRLILPHGGGAVPYHWGRYRGLAQNLGRPPLEEHLLGNVTFDTCVYHQAGIDLLVDVVPLENVLFGSETIGAVPGVDPATGHAFDDTRRYLELSAGLNDGDRRAIFEDNALRWYPRLGNAAAVQANKQGASK